MRKKEQVMKSARLLSLVVFAASAFPVQRALRTTIVNGLRQVD